jgi:hypothetical protein
MLTGIATADELSARSCTGIADQMARLACYDRAFGVNPVPRSAAPDAATGLPQPASAAPPSTVPKRPEDSFGDTGNLRGSVKPVLPKRVTATVLNAVALGQGLYRLTLDNGQVWETTETDRAMDFYPSNRVTISRMAFGNYLVSLTGQGRTVAIKRIQ